MTALLAGAPAALPPVPADQELMRRLLEQQDVGQALPAPAWTEYLLHLVRTALERLLEPLLRHVPAAGLARALLYSSLAIAALALGALVVRALRRRGRGKPATDTGPAAAGVATRAARALDPADFWIRLDAHLRDGDVAAALETLWWWLAVSVAREPVDPSWTTRELLARAGRGDLGGFSVALDRLTYAAARPQAADVRAFAERLQAAL
jgi:hypothetical protein